MLLQKEVLFHSSIPNRYVYFYKIVSSASTRKSKKQFLSHIPQPLQVLNNLFANMSLSSSTTTPVIMPSNEAGGAAIAPSSINDHLLQVEVVATQSATFHMPVNALSNGSLSQLSLPNYPLPLTMELQNSSVVAPQAVPSNNTNTIPIKKLSALSTAAIKQVVLQKKIQPQGVVSIPEELDIVNVKADGNCLFHSICAQIAGESSASLRSLAVAALKSNIEHLRVVIEAKNSDIKLIRPDGIVEEVKIFDRYCELMGLHGTWGGEIELSILAQVIGRPIAVLVPDYNPLFYPSDINAMGEYTYEGEPIFVYYKDNHYQAMNVQSGALAGDIFKKIIMSVRSNAISSEKIATVPTLSLSTNAEEKLLQPPVSTTLASSAIISILELPERTTPSSVNSSNEQVTTSSITNETSIVVANTTTTTATSIAITTTESVLASAQQQLSDKQEVISTNRVVNNDFDTAFKPPTPLSNIATTTNKEHIHTNNGPESDSSSLVYHLHNQAEPFENRLSGSPHSFLSKIGDNSQPKSEALSSDNNPTSSLLSPNFSRTAP